MDEPKSPKARPGEQEREARLAAALRANLKRRKAAERAGQSSGGGRGAPTDERDDQKE